MQRLADCLSLSSFPPQHRSNQTFMIADRYAYTPVNAWILARLHVLPAFAWGFSRCTAFRPQSKNACVRLIGIRPLAENGWPFIATAKTKPHNRARRRRRGCAGQPSWLYRVYWLLGLAGSSTQDRQHMTPLLEFLLPLATSRCRGAKVQQ